VLESSKVQGQFLHASAYKYGNRHPHAESHEINLNFRNTTFTVYSHLSFKEDHKGFIKGGTVIQLFHKVCKFYEKRSLNINMISRNSVRILQLKETIARLSNRCICEYDCLIHPDQVDCILPHRLYRYDSIV